MEQLVAVWDFVQNAIVFLWGMSSVQFIVYHVLLNLGVALAAAIRTGEFKFYRVWEFLYRKLLPFVLVYAFARGLGETANQGWLAVTVLGLIEMTLAADMVENLALLGVPIPDAILKLIDKSKR